jgi:hypothetical protein
MEMVVPNAGRGLYLIAVPDAVGAKLVADELTQEAVVLVDLREEAPEDAVPTARAHTALCVRYGGVGHRGSFPVVRASGSTTSAEAISLSDAFILDHKLRFVYSLYEILMILF